MKAFRFRLQTLLDVAEQREQGVRHELARALGVESDLRRKLEETRTNWLDWEQRLRETQCGVLDVRRLNEHIATVRMLQRRMGDQQQALRAAEQVTLRIRERLTDAAKERRSLERMRERQEDEHTDAVRADEVKRTDDLTTTRVAARSSLAPHDTALTGV